MTKYLIFFSTLLLTGCAPCCYQQQGTTQLQVREQQTCVFEACDVKTTMKAMINTLQDEGFIVKNAVLELGLLTAERQMNVEDSRDSFFSRFFWGGDSNCANQMLLEVSVNITDFGKDTKVRTNFTSKTLDSRGYVIEAMPVTNDRYYQNFFAKVSKGIFFQSENI